MSAEETAQKQPLLSPILRWFMLAMVLANIAGMMTPILLPIYLTDLGADITDVGLVFTLTSVAVLALQIFGGWVSDHIGRLRAVAIGSVGGIIGLSAMLLAPTWQWMIAALIAYQIPFALVGPSFQAFIAENSAEENRGKVYGMTNTIYQITGVIGPPLGGLLAGAFGFKWMLAVSALLYTMAAGLRIWMAATKKSEAKQPTAQKMTMGSFKRSMVSMLGALVGGGLITWIFITDGIGDIAFRMSGELQPLYLEQLAGISVEQIGLLASINALAAMFIPLLAGKMVDKHGERLPLIIGFALIFGAFLIFLRADSFLTFSVSSAVFGLGGGMLGPPYQSLISKVVPSKMLGTFSGVFNSSRGFISLPAPWLGAQLWERVSPQTPFIVTAAASLLIIVPIYFKFKAPDKPLEIGGSQPAAEPVLVETGE
ncbi:MAG: MFS transporter [Anaerolineaceae bacterium]|nr:MFS transporter [Anaerolineaceae bacterium]